MNDPTILQSLSHLWTRVLTRRRKVQGAVVATLMVLGGLAELLTIGAVIPLLAVFADVGDFAAGSRLGGLVEGLGLTPGRVSLLPVALLFCGFALGSALLRVGIVWISQRYVFRIGFDIGVALYERLLHQPYAFHIKANSSEAIANLENIQRLLRQTFIPLMQALAALVVGAFIVTALVLVSPGVTLAAFLAFAGLYVVFTLALRPRLRANSAIIVKANKERVQAVQEGLGGIRDVLLDNAQDVYRRKFARIDNRLRAAQGANALYANAPRYMVEAAAMILLVGMVVYLSNRHGGLAAALPTIGALALGAQRLLPLLQQVYSGFSNLLGNRASLIGVVGLLQEPVQTRFASARVDVPPLREAIVLDDLSFRYDPALPRALRNVDLTLPRGVRAGLIGPSGSGKTTLMDLVMGLLQPTGGAIRVDGVALDEAHILSWQEQIAHVPQHVFLIDESIAANVAFGCRAGDIDIARVTEACRLAQLDTFVEALPEGYDTFVGERGVRLSGGQRQRIGIARALYKRASVLVLDEATSALDDATEARVIDAVEALGRDFTVLMIAHRLTSLKGCDVVYRLEHGRVVEARDLDYSPAVLRRPAR